MSLIRKFATVASGTLMSRVLGFAREMLMAAALGTGPIADAFNAAFQFPNTFRRLFAEGAFNAAFVPLFAKEIEANGIDGAKRFSEEVFGVLFTVLLVLTIAMELAMPLLVRPSSRPAFADNPQKFDLTVALATIMFPYLVCMSLGAMMSGMLNSLRRYFAAAVAPVFLNLDPDRRAGLCLVAGPRRARRRLRPGLGRARGRPRAAGDRVGARCRYAGISIGFRRPRMTPQRQAAAGAGLPGGDHRRHHPDQPADRHRDRLGQDSAVSSLAYADRIYQLPLGVVGIAVAIVLLARARRGRCKSGNLREAENLQNRSVEFTLFLTLPAAAALLVMAEPIVRVLYERGAFAANNSTPTVSAILAIFGLGLPAFVLIKAFTPGYFAREDTRTPMVFAAISVVVNVSTALTLFPSIGAPGIAVASAAAGWVNAFLLLAVLVRRGQWGSDVPLLTRIPRLVAAAAVMAIAAHYGVRRLAPYLAADAPLAQQAIALGALMAASGLIYFIVAFGTGGADYRMIRRSVGRRAASPPVEGT